MTANIPAPLRAGRKEWIGLAVLTLPTLLLSMDMTVLYLAIPQLITDLDPTANQLLWITDIYGFLVAGFLVTMGNLGDRIGRRRLLMYGGFAFAAASVLAAFAPTAEFLIAARALMGIAGATLMPSTLALLRNMFLDDAQRTQAIAIWMSSFMVGTIIGPLVGGVLLEFFNWGTVFLLAVPVMLLLLLTGNMLLPEYRDPNPGPLDFTSVFLSLATILPVIYGIKEFAKIGRDGLFGPPTIALLIGITAGYFFVRRQRTLASPLIDMALFANPRFSASLGTLALTLFAMAGVFFFISQYLQLVKGLSPLMAGVWSLPQAAAMLVAAILTPQLGKYLRPAYQMSIGLAIAAIGMGIVATLDATSPLWIMALSQTVTALGMAPTFILGLDMIVGTAPPERAGAASAISETAQEFGFASGVAVLGSLGGVAYRSTLDDTLPSGLSADQAAAARETLAGALDTATTLPADLASQLIVVARDAFVVGLRLDALIGMTLILIVATLPLAFLRHVQPASAHEGAEDPTATPLANAAAYE